ncbi:hypothetical protein L6V77_33650 [Myxococcota bacterium]|jgi:hypothetical protein|nr:hypothetical protein [Myxococcota bacterium]
MKASFAGPLLSVLAVLTASCGDDAGAGRRYDPDLVLSAFRIQCKSDGFWAGVAEDKSDEETPPETGAITAVDAFRWTLATGELQRAGRLTPEGQVFALGDAVRVRCDEQGVVLALWPRSDGGYGDPVTKSGKPGALRGGAVQHFSGYPTVVVQTAEGGPTVSAVTAYFHDLTTGEAGTPLNLLPGSGPGLWEAQKIGTTPEGLLYGALAFDAAGGLLGTLGL